MFVNITLPTVPLAKASLDYSGRTVVYLPSQETPTLTTDDAEAVAFLVKQGMVTRTANPVYYWDSGVECFLPEGWTAVSYTPGVEIHWDEPGGNGFYAILDLQKHVRLLCQHNPETVRMFQVTAKLCPRFAISETHNWNDETLTVRVTDGGRHTVDLYAKSGSFNYADGVPNHILRERLRGGAINWLNVRYPEWQDPAAYWNDNQSS